jgi:Leucine-rich repeat (LRR) protein
MNSSPLVEYVQSPDFDQEKAKCLAAMISSLGVGAKIGVREMKSALNLFRPGNSAAHYGEKEIVRAERAFQGLSKLHLSVVYHPGVKIRSIDPVRFAPGLQEFVSEGNAIRDLGPISSCAKIQYIRVVRNQGRLALTDIGELKQLEALDLQDTRVKGFNGLDQLPLLKVLCISAEDANHFRKLKRLSKLEMLQFNVEKLDSFLGFPLCPCLKSIRSVMLQSLSGIERYTSLVNLDGIFGNVKDLEPLAPLRLLTHVRIGQCQITTLKPLSGLTELRQIIVFTDASTLDWPIAKNLPKLRQIRCGVGGSDENICLSSDGVEHNWDEEFASELELPLESLKIRIVADSKFDALVPFATPLTATMVPNPMMIVSELYWMEHRISRALDAMTKVKGQDFFPEGWQGGRMVVVKIDLGNFRASLRSIMEALRDLLRRSRNSWTVLIQENDDAWRFWLDRDVLTLERSSSARVLRLYDADEDGLPLPQA